MDQEKIEVTINITNTDELTEKTEKLVSLLKEAKSLINDLAPYNISIQLDSQQLATNLHSAIHDKHLTVL